VDQGIVSLGAFLFNVQLARQLPVEEYGVFALLLGAFLGLQLITSSLLLYPMSIRLPVTQGSGRDALLSATFLLVTLFCVPLAAVLAAALYWFDRGDLILPALAAYLAWQMQEVMRRGLLAEFRHRDAVFGDALSCLGLVVVIALVAYSGHLTLSNALLVMAGSYAAGAVMQTVQLRLSLRQVADLRRTAIEFWSVGGWSLVNNVVSLLRIQIFPWTLAATGGAGAAALFQAALNVVNLANPIILGLCNVIPQTAAKAQQSGGNAGAWRASRIYMLIGVPPTFGYYALVLAVPGLVLSVFYGSASPYVALTFAVQILVVAWAIGYAADMTCSYLHGVNGARFALVINTVGTVASVIFALLLTPAYGLTGGCLSLLGANIARIIASHFIQRRVTANECIA
jgi:O-antigen/teichoic acid export membrane protein